MFSERLIKLKLSGVTPYFQAANLKVQFNCFLNLKYIPVDAGIS
jgi:hypothetical protein